MIAIVLLLALAQDTAPAAPVRDPSLCAELLERMKAEQDVRFEFLRLGRGDDVLSPEVRATPEIRAVFEKMAAIDRDNLDWFKGVVREKGWPGLSMVGRDGATGAFLIAQHATGDLDFMAECLPMLAEAHQAGDAEGEWVALMTDRLLILKDGKEQRYGSQLETRDGRLVPQPIEDEAHVDERRAAMGMPPLAEYLKLANAMQAPGPAAPAVEEDEEPGFVPIFSGEDLTGWRFEGRDLAGETATEDGRFAVRDGVLVITGSAERPPVMEEIDTVESYDGDFTLRLEFRASTDANSGLHLRDKVFAHQLQIRDYPRVGPYKDLKDYNDGGWNAVEVVVTGNTARCTCNGELLEAALEIPEAGPLALQSEINVVEYRNIRIKRDR